MSGEDVRINELSENVLGVLSVRVFVYMTLPMQRILLGV